jgi:hypothetical protein
MFIQDEIYENLMYFDAAGGFQCGTTVDYDPGNPCGELTNGNIYYIWLNYKGTGGCDFYCATANTRPGSPSKSLAFGGAFSEAARFIFQGSLGGIYEYDHIRINGSYSSW